MALRSLRPLSTSGSFMHENREASEALMENTLNIGRREKANRRTSRMHASEESDRGIVSMKHSNKDARALAESAERRPRVKENVGQPNAHLTQSRVRVSQGLAGVRKVAKANREAKFTALLHHVTPELLRESYFALKRSAAPGIDRVTWKEYATGLDDRIRDLHSRVHRGSYRAAPSRRVYIPKADGNQRPLGIAALEDKIVQQAVVTILNEIYETDFLGFSYGFRPGRGPHQALDALVFTLVRKYVNFVLDVDIRAFFDSVDHEWMLKFLQHRIADPRMLRLIKKWLTAGVMEDGELKEVEMGTPQGSVISPLLANIYLHYTFDQWVTLWRKKRTRGEVVVVRYADDIIVGFRYQADAERFLEDLRARLRKFGLELHPDKTRLIEFGRFARQDRMRRGEGKPETFDFLGFTHICARSRNDRFVVRRKTVAARMRAKLYQIKVELRRRWHHPVPKTGQWLRSVVKGYFNYYAVPFNMHSLKLFRFRLLRIWQRALNRRSQKDGTNRHRTAVLVDRWLPRIRVLHPYPDERFAATHPRWEPYALMSARTDLCGGCR